MIYKYILKKYLFRKKTECKIYIKIDNNDFLDDL